MTHASGSCSARRCWRRCWPLAAVPVPPRRGVDRTRCSSLVSRGGGARPGQPRLLAGGVGRGRLAGSPAGRRALGAAGACVSVVAALAAWLGPGPRGRLTTRGGPGASRSSSICSPSRCCCAVTTNNVGLMWVAIEATTITSALLIPLDVTKASVEASWKYLAARIGRHRARVRRHRARRTSTS